MENALLLVNARFLFYKPQGYKLCIEVNPPWKVIPKEKCMPFYFKKFYQKTCKFKFLQKKSAFYCLRTKLYKKMTRPQ